MTYVLLAVNELMGKYAEELERAGFIPLHTSKGSGIAKIVEEYHPQIIVADTELEDDLSGDKACRALLKEDKIRKTYILALANTMDKGRGWEGVCHQFREKKGIRDLGETIKYAYEHFQRNAGLLRYREFPKPSSERD
jgi:hypothetical protein